MMMESFVAVMALVSASIIEPGIYFTMNSPAAQIGTTSASAAAKVSEWGFAITPEQIDQTAKDVGEHTIISRTGGAPTLAVGMAQIFASALGGKAMMAFWYHFAILFEALFILTAVDAGTRAGRFMLQDLLGVFAPGLADTTSWVSNIVATALCVGAWGYFLYQGVTDPLGGVNTLWPLFGISNQMLAAVALTLCTVVIFKMKRERYAWVTMVPLTWLVICTVTAGLQKIFHPDPRIGFLSHANRYSDALAQGQVLAPAKDAGQMSQIVFNDRIDAALACLFVLVVISILYYGVRSCLDAYRTDRWTAHETDMTLPISTGAGATAAAAAMR
jgi:carbon starvation protein